MVEIEQAFGITISPAEFDKEAWATPRAIVADLERRLAGGRAS
jgi:acyl carrier protein